MIAYLHGTLKRKFDDLVVVETGGVGYEVYLPQFVRRTYDDKELDSDVELEVYYYASERQVRPVLFGFNSIHERQFFEKIITVEDVGPIKASRALVLSVSTIANAIETENVATLKSLPGIGDRTAKKMIATLRGRCAEEALLLDEGFDRAATPTKVEHVDLKTDALDILVSLGHRRSEAESKIDAALAHRPDIGSPEELIREVYRRESRT